MLILFRCDHWSWRWQEKTLLNHKVFNCCKLWVATAWSYIHTTVTWWFWTVSLKKDWGYKVELDIADHTHSPVSSSFNGHYFTKFRQLTEDEVRKLIMSSKSTMCELDPIPTSLLKGHISILLPLITKMVNLSLQTGVFPNEWKLALVTPLIKKPGLEHS